MSGNSGRYKVLRGGAVIVHWKMGDGSLLTLVANLFAEPLAGIPKAKGREIFSIGSVEDGGLGAWSIAWSLQNGVAPTGCG